MVVDCVLCCPTPGSYYERFHTIDVDLDTEVQVHALRFDEDFSKTKQKCLFSSNDFYTLTVLEPTTQKTHIHIIKNN